MKRIFRFIKALWRYVLYGQDVSPDVWNNRYNICKNCEKLKGKKCSICGCYVKTKTRWSTEKCPENKWDQIRIGGLLY